MFCESLIKMNLKVFVSFFFFNAFLAYERLSRNDLLLGGRRKLYSHTEYLTNSRLIGIDYQMKDFIEKRDYW